ncbi:nad dependent epimerase dehydratase family [Trichoderma arundinaceum]|uniref:Nad dependent epimerase dehydratase family n=1 Tax=Trichoderma arundinaceum TaxID=490622 RepID=A0A395NDC6_TRIAR|nr:nad dependent epimerase dehydratase family [Trichoderma arundinaceum]
MHNVLITGVSGYLGGSILAQLHNLSSGRTVLPAYGTIYAFVRSDTQAHAVQAYGAEPAVFDLDIWGKGVLGFVHKRPGPNHISQAVGTNNIVIVLAEELGVKSYIFAPCIICHMLNFKLHNWKRQASNDHGQMWPVRHIEDNTDLYIRLLAAILSGNSNPDHGRHGYYLPSGSVAWDNIYSHMGAALAKKSIVEDERVMLADDVALEAMSRGLNCPQSLYEGAVSWQNF